MDKLARGYRAKNIEYDVDELNEMDSDTLLVIKLPDSWVLRIISRSLFLAMVILTLPYLSSVLKTSSNNDVVRTSSNDALYEHDIVADSGFKVVPILFRDLLEEGLIKKGQRGLVLGASDGANEDDFEFLKDAGIDLLAGADLQHGKLAQHQTFDFVFAVNFRRIHQFDGVLKEGGLAISPLGNGPLTELGFLRNYKIVYLRRFENTVVVMRKIGASLNGKDTSLSKQAPCGVSPEKKKAALKGLEDVYLEPPTRPARAKKPSFTSRKIKFLPDLLKDSLDQYPRRVFISDESRALDWFYKNYPMRDQEFEVYDMEIVSNNNVISQETGVSTWLTKNVRRDDYVVMKAEAQVVEEMLKDGTICLVDELFLECRNQWQDGEDNGSKRAYWQCLALYGKVKDEGIAVHQWWN